MGILDANQIVLEIKDDKKNQKKDIKRDPK